MTLAVVGRYLSLPEAHVVCGALCSAGLQATVFDATFGAVNWTQQMVLGGFRVVVPMSDLETALAVLGPLTPRAKIEPPANDPFRFWAALGLTMLSATTAMAWAGFRTRPNALTASALLFIGASTVSVALLMLKGLFIR